MNQMTRLSLAVDTIHRNANVIRTRVEIVLRRHGTPRNTALAVFKTNDRGWGVKTLEDIKKGKLIGVCTGRIIARRVAKKIIEEDNSFRMDIDGLEHIKPRHFRLQNCTLDCRERGNWTRFVNHSCEPNMTVVKFIWKLESKK